MPRLSVIMPVKNGARTIAIALRSTLRALPRDAEVIVFNDGSTDATAAVLASFDEPRLTTISSDRSIGIPQALTSLLESSDSEFVARMDADDVVLPGRFRYQQAAMDLSTSVVFTTVADWHRPSWRPPVAKPIAISASAFPFHLLLTNPVSHPTMLARRSALEEVGGYRQVPAEDYDLWLRLATAGSRIRRLALPTLLYRIHASQVTASKQWRSESWRNQLTADAFADLSSRVLGHRFLRLVAVGSDPAIGHGEFLAMMNDFRTAFISATDSLPPVERRMVRAKLVRRVGATLDQRSRLKASV